MEILFVHGAGEVGFDGDRPLADALRTRLGVTVSISPYPHEDMSAAGWRRELDRQRGLLGPEVLVVGHSFGASIALQHLADDPWEHRPLGLALLAMPYWGPEGWDVADYALPADAHLPSDLPVWLHHCRDDEVVEFSHLDYFAAALPQAVVRRHDAGGHQLDGCMDLVAGDLSTVLRSNPHKEKRHGSIPDLVQ